MLNRCLLFALLLAIANAEWKNCENDGINPDHNLDNCREKKAKDQCQRPVKSSTTAAATSLPTQPPTASWTESAVNETTSAAPVTDTTAANLVTVTSVQSSDDCGCECPLVVMLLRVKIRLSISLQVIFEEYIQRIRVIVDDAIDDELKVTLCVDVLTECFEKHSDIKKEARDEKIEGYGRCEDFQVAGWTKDANKTKQLMVPDANGNCKYVKYIEDGTANDKCGPGSSAKLAVFLRKAKKICKRNPANMDHGRKLGLFRKILRKYVFKQNPELRECVENIRISELGGNSTLRQCLGSQRLNELQGDRGSKVLIGSSASCVLLVSVKQGIDQAAANNSVNSTIIAEARAYHQKCSDYFSVTVDLQLRNTFISVEWSKLSPECREFVQEISIQVDSDDEIRFIDVVKTGYFCENNGECSDINSGGCSAPPELLIEPDSTQNNSTEFESCVEEQFLSNCTFAEKSSYNSYRLSISNCIRKSDAGPDWGALGDRSKRWQCVLYYVRAFAKNVPLLRSRYVAVEFYSSVRETTTSLTFETVGSSCGC